MGLGVQDSQRHQAGAAVYFGFQILALRLFKRSVFLDQAPVCIWTFEGSAHRPAKATGAANDGIRPPPQQLAFLL
jgi:hypothetical protein